MFALQLRTTAAQNNRMMPLREVITVEADAAPANSTIVGNPEIGTTIKECYAESESFLARTSQNRSDFLFPLKKMHSGGFRSKQCGGAHAKRDVTAERSVGDMDREVFLPTRGQYPWCQNLVSRSRKQSQRQSARRTSSR
jgi:hypothetical protein